MASRTPSHFNDRLLLGLKGTMSEAELPILRARLQGGILAKARRGELETALPVGLTYAPDGTVVLDPDQQVQASLRRFFETFRQTGSASATVRSFREGGLLFPRRLRSGPHKGDLVWGALRQWRALRVLSNPRYAGAFAYGRTRTQRAAHGHHRVSQRPREEWHTLLLDNHPGSLSWSEHEENLRRLRENAQAHGRERGHSPPREGPALLQGLLICGRCGGRMTVRYRSLRVHPTGHGRLLPIYVCHQEGVQTAQPPVRASSAPASTTRLAPSW
jgi:hypothetical protein